MSAEEDLLLDRVRQKEAQALAELLQFRRPRLMAVIEHELGAALRSKLEPDDIFQEVAQEALRSLPAMELTDRDPHGWLCQIIQRKIVDAHRRFFEAQKRASGREMRLNAPVSPDSSRGLIDLLVASMTTPSQAVVRDERQAALLEALEQLPPEQKEALRLRYVEGWPSKQIADSMNKSDGAIRVMLTRALKRLEELLGPEASPFQ